ncbi:MAG TPA: hypothetical protein VFA22_10015 [Stellaceae bacterium]|nr:hypothetical protein [Stellaceae bacterium]
MTRRPVVKGARAAALALGAALLAGCVVAPPPPSAGPGSYDPRLYDATGNLATAAPPPADCREFQRTVEIGGKRQNAYGIACRQPDGSWRITN